MIFKQADDRSADIAELERLLVTEPISARASIEKQLRNIRAGAAGERDAAHFINREVGPSQRVAVLHDLRIGTDGDFAQIDHLLIHRLQACAWVLETKNYSGRLSCDEHGDWTVWRNGKPQPIPSPISQAQRHCRALERWLEANEVTWIREIHAVVLVSPTSSVDRRKLPKQAHVVKSDNFAAWWSEQGERIGVGTALQMLGRHLTSGMSMEDFENLAKRLAEAHVPPSFDWQRRLGARSKDAGGKGAPQSSELKEQPVPTTPAHAIATEVPPSFETPFGTITLQRLADGRYTLRNEDDERLISIVKKAAKGKARWSPRFRNWVTNEAEIMQILRDLEHALNEQ